MHHDKLKKCDARKLPKWLVDYMKSLQSKSPGDLDDNPDDEVSAGGSCNNTSAKDPADTATEERLGKQPDGPFSGTRSRSKAITKHDGTIVAKPLKRGQKKVQKSYCVCKKQNPKGLMVQCDSCKDWFHPECVGITAEIAEMIPLYTCPECSPIDGQ